MSFMWIVAIMTLIGLGLDYTMGYIMDFWLYMKVRNKSDYQILSDKLSKKAMSGLDVSGFSILQQFIIVFLTVIITYTLWPIGGLWAEKEVIKDYKKVYTEWKEEQSS